jgi:Uma2 family endonuclease
MDVAVLETIWTYDDLLDLPEDGRRYEIIGGVLYEMAAPTTDHQSAIMNLVVFLLPVVRALGGRMFTAPIDVFLADADPVQPDVLVLLADRLRLISRRGIEGAPSFLIEVFSPSNREHDQITKRALYARGGVPELWHADPEERSVEVLVLENGVYRTLAKASGDELVRSRLFPDLVFPAAAVFAPALPA